MLRQRERQFESAAASGGGVERGRAVMKLSDVLDDGKAQPRAALVAAAVLVHAVEPLEDAGAMLRRNADAVVLDGENRLFVVNRK